MANQALSGVIESIMSDFGVPRKIKENLEESLHFLNGMYSDKEKIAHVISVLDDASANPNLSINARTHIWNILSNLEEQITKK